MIKFWKVMLWEKYQARPGQKIGISMLEVDPYHISLIFAAGELGLGFVILDHPIGEWAMDKTKAALFAPIDLGVECKVLGADHLNRIMTRKFCTHNISVDEFDSYVIQNDISYSEVADKIFSNPDDILLWVSTSGTSSPSKPVAYTHKYVVKLARRNSVLFGIQTESNVVHTRNMHHVSSLLIHFLPSICASKNHWTKYVNTSKSQDLTDFVSMLSDNKINFMLVCNLFDLEAMFGKFQEQNLFFQHDIELNLSGFHLTPKILQAARRHNLNIVSTFGSVDTACPLFVRRIGPATPDSDMEPGLVGEFYDDGFYQLTVSDSGIVTVDCRTCWPTVRYLNDSIERRGDKFYHIQRDNVIAMKNYEFNLTDLTNAIKTVLGYDDVMVVVDKEYDCLYLVLWDTGPQIDIPMFNANLSNSAYANCQMKKIVNLEKQKFTLDTKVNVDQLRGYLQQPDIK